MIWVHTSTCCFSGFSAWHFGQHSGQEPTRPHCHHQQSQPTGSFHSLRGGCPNSPNSPAAAAAQALPLPQWPVPQGTTAPAARVGLVVGQPGRARRALPAPAHHLSGQHLLALAHGAHQLAGQPAGRGAEGPGPLRGAGHADARWVKYVGYRCMQGFFPGFPGNRHK